MIEQIQLINHDPKSKKYGDCFRTLLACFLDKSPGEVPHFFNKEFKTLTEVEIAYRNYRDYLESINLRMVMFPCPYGILNGSVGSFSKNNPGIYCMMHGYSKGTHHVCIYLNGNLFWDPSGNMLGLDDKCEDGFFWVTLLIDKRFGE